MTYEERLAANLDKHSKQVEFWKRWFIENPTKLSTGAGITFVGQKEHDERLSLNKAITNAGFRVTSTPPEYDGMVRWTYHLTDKVDLL